MNVATVRQGLADRQLREPSLTHSVMLVRRLAATRGLQAKVSDSAAYVAGLDYLAARVETPDLPLAEIAASHQMAEWRMLAVLDELRVATGYRAYVGEWIRDGCPAFSDDLVEDEDEAEELLLEQDGDLLLEQVVEETYPDSIEEPGLAPAAPMLAEAPRLDARPTRWRAPFLPYQWQLEAARAWESNNGRGIMQVVTGAGKTALAVYLYGRLLDRLDTTDQEAQLIVVVPRIELARQWAREIRTLLRLDSLRVGQYHSEHRCRPELQDVLIITQDSARQVLPRLRFDRPVLLIADECHRLGAPAASRILARDYTWTLGLSATPERSGDFAFDEVLVPRLGPVVFKYGYKEAVRDGIIASFRLTRVKVQFSPDEASAYEEHSAAVTRLLTGLKASYPELIAARSRRFWQAMGALRQRNRSDQRFDMLTATANQRRSIVHFAVQKLGLVQHLARALPPQAKVLCFHERIEAADRLKALCEEGGSRAVVYHSQIPEDDRTENLSSFRAGEADWLIACKSLDEGLDIPAVDTIVIAAGTKSPRQLIQRLGRALRRKEHDRVADIYFLEVEGADDEMLSQEDLSELVEAAAEIRDVSGNELQAMLSTLSVGGRPAPQVRGAKPPQSRPQQSKPTILGSVGRAIVSGFRRLLPDRSWTGTPGTTSYYDKDSSPD